MSKEISDLNIEEATEWLGDYYDQAKHAKKKQDELRLAFFDLASEAVRERGVTTEAQLIYGPTKEEAVKRCELYYPAHIVINIDPDPDEEGKWYVLLEELPQFKAYTYVNHNDGKVYKRSITKGSLQLDDGLLRERDPNLYARVTEVPQREWLTDLLYEANVPKGEIDELIDSFSLGTGANRELKSFDAIDPEDLALLKEYMYETKPQAKLTAPRKAKPEELEDE